MVTASTPLPAGDGIVLAGNQEARVTCDGPCRTSAGAALVVGPFGALASPVRIRLLLALADEECSVSTLARHTGLALATVSQHLQRLAAAAFVSRRRAGTSVLYRLADPAVLTLLAEAGRSSVRAETTPAPGAKRRGPGRTARGASGITTRAGAAGSRAGPRCGRT
jgi:DNA-binding transcriptional ArsR family regulator